MSRNVRLSVIPPGWIPGSMRNLPSKGRKGFRPVAFHSF